jgi:hypothetical protein
MPWQSKQIKSFLLNAGINNDSCRIVLKFMDGSQLDYPNLPPSRFAAIVSVLQATPQSYYAWDDSGIFIVASAEDVPGH